MLWRDFAPYVLPYVVGCPMPVLEHHARLTAIDWCRKTFCHTIDLDPLAADGNALLVMDPLSQTEIVKVLAVAVGGKDWTLVDSRKGQQHVRAGEPGDFCFTQDNKSLAVYPVQVAGVEVVVTASLMPILNTSKSLDADVASQYADDIAKGIIAAIMRLPKQDYTDPGGALMHQTMYEQRRGTIAAKMSRGLSASKMRNHMTFI